MAKANKELNSRILEAVQMTAPLLDDYGQRSAIGMARSWLEHHKPIKREANSLDKYIVRDNLAEELVRIFEEEEADKRDGIAALAGARAWVNEPFINPDMNGQKNRESNLKPGAME